MKRCPKCNADYFDNMLEFCLEDGTRLTALSSTAGTSPVITESSHQRPTIASETVSIPLSANPVVNRESREVETLVATAKTPIPGLNASGNKILESVPIVIALAHNWWQWIYLEKQYVSSISSYILSANFLMWLLLLVGGSAISLLAIKHGEKKTAAYTALVILAINLILFLVPRR